MNPRPARTASSATLLARPALRRIRRSARILCTTAAALLLSAAAARAVNPAPAQLFYVPFPEDQLLQGLQAIDFGNGSADPTNPMTTYVSIAAVADGTILYYDQWENGYDADIANPANLYSSPGNTGGTQIWGDGNPANGAPPGLPGDVIDAGTVIVLNNSLNTTNLSAIDFDGRDKIAATKTVAVSRTGWATGSSTLLAGSVEVFDTGNWGTDYRVPVGADIPDATDAQMFEYTSLAIQAGEGGATVQVDKDANGSFETTQTLSEGQSLFIDGGVEVGGRVISDHPVQVVILTGDIGSNYESRDSSLLPVNLWSTSYYEPVSTTSSAGTTVWLYNPGTTTLVVQYTTRNGSGVLTTTSINVPGGTNGGYTSQVIPDGYGAHFEAVSPFYAFSTTDSTSSNTGDNQSWDWGFSLVPEDSLTPQILIGLGIGRDPTNTTTSLTQNGNPVWVTPVGNGDTAVRVYADFDADPSTGANTDPNGSKYDVFFDLKELERAKIYDTNDRNQTGMLVYVLTANVKLAAAWGQDPTTASAGAPGLDVGTGVPPLPLFSAGKNGTLFTDADGDGFVSPGDTLLYTIAITNISRAPVPNLNLQDTIPAGTAYVPGTTTLKIGSGPVNPIADDGSGTPFPLDGAGKVLDPMTALVVGGSYEVTFKVAINAFANLPNGTSSILNVCTATAVGVTQTCRDTTPLYGRIGDFVWLDIDGDGVQDGGAEVGIAGVTVDLYVDLNGNGVIDGADSIVATQVTNGSGGYLFTGVPAGTYVVDVATTNPALADLTLTTANDPKAVDLAGGEWRLDVDFGYRNLCVQTNGQAVVCTNGGECSDPGICQPATGLCSAPTPKANGTACSDDGNACTVDACQSGACAHTPGNTGTVCRASAGDCDVAETCTGSSATCPADGFASSATVCRAQNGVCDVAETCTGSSASCPADGVKSGGTQCRAANGVCDVAEVCNGSGKDCPGDGFASSATICRAQNGLCDVAETCTGSSAACPTDGFAASGTQCRVATGDCDVAEVCNGSSAACPTDGVKPNGTQCRASAGVCDVAEACNGSGKTCPTDGFAPGSTVCRTANGACDVAEQCTGSSAACPTDGFAPGSTVCRAANGTCDVAEQCSGSSAACPSDGFAPGSTVCRAANGVCDVAEQCTGSSAACPADGVKQSGVLCRAANGTCDVAESCDGSGKDCPVDGVKQSGVLCRAASGACDVAEVCDGTATACPNDGFAPASTVCRASAGACDVAEQCTGSSAACPADGVAPSGTVCRASAGVCDVAEACNGTGAACPNDGFVAAGTQCRAANGQCDVAEACTGAGATCPTDGLKPNGSTCTDGDLCTQTDTCQAGSCVGANPVQCTVLDQCHLPGTCEPSTGQCSNPTVADGTTCSDGDLCSAGDQCVGGICTGVETLCELCADLEDNDNDGLIDCLDPDCPTCPPIVDTCNHPCVTQIIFQRRGLDLLRLQASFKPFTPIDPATEQVGLLITNADGVVFADLLAPGTVKRVGKSWTATVKASKTAGGIFKVRFTRLVDGTYRVNFKAYGAMKAKATLATMSVQILVGDDVAISTENWETIKTGWRVQLE